MNRLLNDPGANCEAQVKANGVPTIGWKMQVRVLRHDTDGKQLARVSGRAAGCVLTSRCASQHSDSEQHGFEHVHVRQACWRAQGIVLSVYTDGYSRSAAKKSDCGECLPGDKAWDGAPALRCKSSASGRRSVRCDREQRGDFPFFLACVTSPTRLWTGANVSHRLTCPLGATHTTSHVARVAAGGIIPGLSPKYRSGCARRRFERC